MVVIVGLVILLVAGGYGIKRYLFTKGLYLDVSRLEIERKEDDEPYELIYADNDKGSQKGFIDRRLRLAGRPDFIIGSDAGTEPVEFKSSKTPSLPYSWHIVQLSAYMFLVGQQDTVHQGRIKYKGAEFIVKNNRYLQKYTLRLLRELRSVARGRRPIAKANPAKCRSCPHVDKCPFKVVD